MCTVAVEWCQCHWYRSWSLSTSCTVIMPLPLMGGGIKCCFCLTSVCLTFVMYIGPNSRTERPRNSKIGTEVAHVMRDSDTTFRVKRSRSLGRFTHRGLNEWGKCNGDRENILGVGNYCYVASARHRVRRWESTGAGEGRHVHSLFNESWDVRRVRKLPVILPTLHYR